MQLAHTRIFQFTLKWSVCVTEYIKNNSGLEMFAELGNIKQSSILTDLFKNVQFRFSTQPFLNVMI